ncbi:Ras GTPase activating protein [Blumeria hordei DH14]|uniref:Ras GTPase activating protein n=1 Tax=Blumeria graminis f. sp. hordei (strain DH14) TaxID=546991 RepID=N1JLK5_BLUG1|nr:Ras GTPase activating protein [Blumeria hordei DH14]
MSHNHPFRHSHTVELSSNQRQTSNASTASTSISNTSSASEIYRTSTNSSNESYEYTNSYGKSRGMEGSCNAYEKDCLYLSSPKSPYKSPKHSAYIQSHKPNSPVSNEVKPPRNQTYPSVKTSLGSPKTRLDTDLTPKKTGSTIISRENSIRRRPGSVRGHAVSHSHSPLRASDIQELQRSSTSQLRTLSKLARNTSTEEFSIISPNQEVTGLHGRRRLQRSDTVIKNGVYSSTRGGYGWEFRNWMDKQRQFIQAYEYLCHIGEAKEWIEDILQKPIPPIVQLEESLRDGIALAEIVQTLCPNKQIRIFRHPKLQYRHSDNIAIFFRFLADVELPDLFRFELTDLYEKKNTPKVIYCVHALSWLLFRKGIVDFQIGNLLGQLEFEHHELEEMQKGLEKAGVNMPIFGNMSVDLGVPSLPEPEQTPPDNEANQITRKLHEYNPIIIDIQAQARGAIERMRLATIMEQLWDSEERLVELQALIRGDFSRQIARYRGNMRIFAINIQSRARGLLIRLTYAKQKSICKSNELCIKKIQSLIRGKNVRLKLHSTFSNLREYVPGLEKMQAIMRGFLIRQAMIIQKEKLSRNFETVKNLQSKIRGLMMRTAITIQRDQTHTHICAIRNFQADARGLLIRRALLAHKNEVLIYSNMMKLLQANIRGQLSRRTVALQERELTSYTDVYRSLQSDIRGLLIRRTALAQKNEILERELISYTDVYKTLQSDIRGLMIRKAISTRKNEILNCIHSVKILQSNLRGMLCRRAAIAQKNEVFLCSSVVKDIQAAIRGNRLRTSIARDLHALSLNNDSILSIQSNSRALIRRKNICLLKTTLTTKSPTFISFQSILRGNCLRNKNTGLIEDLKRHNPSILYLQAIIRAKQINSHIQRMSNALSSEEFSVVFIQTRIRGMLIRRGIGNDHEALFASTTQVSQFEAISRGFLGRKFIRARSNQLNSHSSMLAELQAQIRAILSRDIISAIIADLDFESDSIISLQAAARSFLIRSKFNEKMRFFKENMEKVVKIQSFVRGRIQGEAYKSLTTGKNPPVNTVKNFVHLLNDSDFDFNEEVEFECLRKTVVQQVRQNEMAEQYIDQLDIKIALLVKNKITLDEVVKHQKNFGGHPGNLLVNTALNSGNQFDLKALNKNSRKKLESYQQLFFTLQTQPRYLAKIFKRIREQGTAEKDCKRIETMIMALFGYAQKRREEYYLLKLISRSAKEEINSTTSIQEYLRGGHFWNRIVRNYTRSPRDRKFLRELLGPMIQGSIIGNPELDLESDPMQIYRSAINNEELRTGRSSHRSLSIRREEAIKDNETREMFINHLQDLRGIVDEFIFALETFVHKMPYGIKFICKQLFEALCEHLSLEPKSILLQVVGSWLWKIYLQPALIAPETMGVVEKHLTPTQKHNLKEVAKVLSQITSGRLFGGDNIYLQPLNAYIENAIKRTSLIFADIMLVPDAEGTFHIDEFNDLYAKVKPTLYIKMADIFAIHQLIAAHLPEICPSRDDVLRDILQELGSAKNNETEMLGVTSTEIQMTLSPKLHDLEDPEAEVKALFMETKRCILYIIRVQTGSNLMDILVRPIKPEDDRKWYTIINEEFSAHSRTRGAYSDANTLVDVKSMSYKDLKRTALENIMKLEQLGRISRKNYYQDILNAIALDIRTKSRRRVMRQRELEGVRLTLTNLNEKAEWLDSQRKSYDNYIEQAMTTLQKKGKKRFLMPFSKQYNHEKELERSGRKPKFGSFKYSARTLYDKGVLAAWKCYGDREWDKTNLTISCDQVGIFALEGSKGSIQIPGASASVSMDSLLAAQFANHQYMELFEGSLRLNVNLFLHLLYKKFYRTDS